MLRCLISLRAPERQTQKVLQQQHSRQFRILREQRGATRTVLKEQGPEMRSTNKQSESRHTT